VAEQNEKRIRVIRTEAWTVQWSLWLLSAAFLCTMYGTVLRYAMPDFGAGSVLVLTGWIGAALGAGAVTDFLEPGRHRRLAWIMLALALCLFLVYLGAQLVSMVMLGGGFRTAPRQPESATLERLSSDAEVAKMIEEMRHGPAEFFRAGSVVVGLLIMSVEMLLAACTVAFLSRLAQAVGGESAAKSYAGWVRVARNVYALPVLLLLLVSLFIPGEMVALIESVRKESWGVFVESGIFAWLVPLVFICLLPVRMAIDLGNGKKPGEESDAEEQEKEETDGAGPGEGE